MICPIKTSIGPTIAFSSNGITSAWDKYCESSFLCNKYESQFYIIQNDEFPTIEGRFLIAEAAYQASKLNFNKFVNQYREINAIQIEYLKYIHQWLIDPLFKYDDKKWRSMLSIIRAKFTRTNLYVKLLETRDWFIINHSRLYRMKSLWSDGYNGCGYNWLGLILMIVREEIREKLKLEPTRWKTIIDNNVNMETGEFTEIWSSYVKSVASDVNTFFTPMSMKCRRLGCPNVCNDDNEYCCEDCKYLPSYIYTV